MTTAVHAADAPLYAEKWRPQFHFTSSTDWLNDPNGLVFFDGEYHLFFQRVPGSNDGNTDTKSWGHAVSKDLARWTQLPDALLPDDNGSIWSGSAVVDWKNTSGFGKDGKPPLVALYTNAKNPFDQRLAYSNDRGRTWTKVAEPILANVHGTNRDPKVIWHEPTQRWIMGLYLDQRHRFALYASPNLKEWSLLHELTLEGDDECPDFFPLAIDGDAAKTRWVFIGANNRYVVGQFDGKQFVAETDSLPSEYGPSFYAAQTFSDEPNGRRVQIGWMRRDGHYPDMPFNQQLSFPSELTLRTTPRGPRLFRWPVKEIETLREDTFTLGDHPLAPGKPEVLGQGQLFDLSLDIEPGDARSVTLDVRGLRVTFHAETPAGGSLTAWDRRVALPLVDGRFKLRVLVDRTSVELFANDGATVMSGCHLPGDDRQQITLGAEGGTARIVSRSVSRLKSAWPTPTTKEASR